MARVCWVVTDAAQRVQRRQNANTQALSELTGFDPGEYTITCSHGRRDSGPSTWWTFKHTIGDTGSASITNQCFVDFATLTGNGAYITVAKTGALVAVSKWLK